MKCQRNGHAKGTWSRYNEFYQVSPGRALDRGRCKSDAGYKDRYLADVTADRIVVTWCSLSREKSVKRIDV